MSAEATTAVKVGKLKQLRGVRSVIIPQFTIEFVSRSDALSAKEEKKQDYVTVVYEVGGIAPSSSAAAVASPLASTAGLGRACAEALLAEGVRVAVNGPDTARTDDRTTALAAPQARCLTSTPRRGRRSANLRRDLGQMFGRRTM